MPKSKKPRPDRAARIAGKLTHLKWGGVYVANYRLAMEIEDFVRSPRSEVVADLVAALRKAGVK